MEMERGEPAVQPDAAHLAASSRRITLTPLSSNVVPDETVAPDGFDQHTREEIIANTSNDTEATRDLIKDKLAQPPAHTSGNNRPKAIAWIGVGVLVCCVVVAIYVFVRP